MSDAAKDNAANKIALIYEFNEESPLFTRVANTQINKGHLDEAMKVLESGIEFYPNYPTAHIIFAKALAYKGNQDRAKEEIRKACEILGDKKTEDYYFQVIEKIGHETGTFSESRRASFFEDDFETTEKERIKNTNNLVDDDLESLAKELDDAKIMEVDEEEEVDASPSDFIYTGKPIISETLAGIYMAQGNLIDAKNVYEQLITKEPDKADHFRQKIAEIEQQISEK